MIPHIIKSFRGGVSDENNKGIFGSFKYGYGLDIHNRDDVLQSNQSMVTVFGETTGIFGSGIGTTQTGIIQFFLNAGDGSTYCFGNQGSIFARSGDGQWNFVYNDENGAIKGAAEWKLSDDTNYLFWATNTSIARKQFQGVDIAPDSGSARWTDATQDWKTTLTSADWHSMKPASGSLMIANGNALAEIDFDGNFNALSLNIRPGNIIKCLDERDDYVVIGSGRLDKSEEGHIWSWIPTALRWIQKKRIPIQGVNALISTEFPLLQGGDDGEIFLADFVNNAPLHAIPGRGQVNPGGITIENDLAVFGFYGGTYPGIWSFGRRMKNRIHALNYNYRLEKTVNGSTISTIAALAMVDGTLFSSWGTTDGSTSEYGIDSVSSTTKASSLYESLEFDGGSTHLKKEFNTVHLVFTPLVSGTSVSVKYRMDKTETGGEIAGGWNYAFSGNSTTFSTLSATEAFFIINDVKKVYELGVELNSSGNNTPVILSIITYLGERSFEYA